MLLLILIYNGILVQNFIPVFFRLKQLFEDHNRIIGGGRGLSRCNRVRAVIFVSQLLKVNLLHFLLVEWVSRSDDVKATMSDVSIDVTLNII